jgi:hypothetical protein
LQPPKSKEDWHVYRDEQIAVQVSFPDTPTVNRQIQHNFQQREDAAGWRFYNQTSLNERENAYYMFLAKETVPGYYL